MGRTGPLDTSLRASLEHIFLRSSSPYSGQTSTCPMCGVTGPSHHLQFWKSLLIYFIGQVLGCRPSVQAAEAGEAGMRPQGYVSPDILSVWASVPSQAGQDLCPSGPQAWARPGQWLARDGMALTPGISACKVSRPGQAGPRVSL